MEIQIKGRVLTVKAVNGNSYVTMNDVEQGGSFQVSIPTVSEIKLDSLLDLKATCQPGMGKFGMYVKVIKIHPGDKNLDNQKQ
jgi:hypothetical protein